MTNNPQEQIEAMNLRVAQVYGEGRYEEAFGIATEAVAFASQHLGKEDPKYATSLNNLALLYQRKGNYAAAVPLVEQALDILRSTLGENSRDFAASLNNLAGIHKSLHNYSAAEPLYQRAVEAYRAALGENHPDYASGLNNLALLHSSMGNYSAAEPLFQRALGIYREALAENHPGYSASLYNLASLYESRGNYAQAESLYEQVVKIERTTLGENHPDYALSLNNLAAVYQARGNYAAAGPLHKQAMTIRRTALGENHPEFAASLNNLASLYKIMGNYAAALPLLQQTVEILRAALGEDHPRHAESLNNLAILYDSMGNHVAAGPLYQKALEIRRAALGERDPDYATSLSSLAEHYHSMGNYAAAEPLFQQAIEIDRTSLGEDDLDYATSLNGLAALYHSMGNYAAAVPLCKQAMEIRRTKLGEGHPDYALSLNDLAAHYQSMGKYASAEPLYHKALEIDRAALGEGHPDYGTSLNNLALLYRSMGDYAAAEPLHQKAMEIRRKALGEGHPSYAASLSSLAVLYRLMGNYSAAEPLYRQAQEIRRTKLGEGHPDYALSLNDLAALYQSMGNYSAAEPLHQKAMEIRRKALGDHHSSYAESLTNLAHLYQSTGDYAAAVPLYEQAVEIDRRALGEQHPDYGLNLNGLAVVYQILGNHAAAEPLYRRALEIFRNGVGEHHPDYAAILSNLAHLCVVTDRQPEAMTLLQQAAAIDDRMIGQVFSVGSESQRMAYLATILANFETFLSLVFHYFSSSPAALQSARDLVLRRKAIGAEALAAQRDAVLGGRYPALEPKLAALTTLRMQIAQKTLAGPGVEDLAMHQKLLAEWNTQKERLEAELVRLIPEMNLEQKLRAADRQAVALALPSESVLVEFVRFNIFDFQAVLSRGERRWTPPRYVAFVLTAQQPDNMQMIDFGLAEPLDQMIATFRATITGDGESRGHQSEEASLSEGLSSVSATEGSALRARIFDPLLAVIDYRRRLFLAPDGDLTRLPFEVLPTVNGRHLIDEYRISYLGTGRDVLRFGAASIGQATAPLVIADPDFDLAGDTNASLQQPAREPADALSPKPKASFWSSLFGRSSTASTPPAGKVEQDQSQGAGTVAPTSSPSRLSRDADRNAMHFGRLPGTQVEGQRIAEMLGVEPRLAAAALESHLKACRSPRILHLATHGFFLADQKHDPNKEQDNVMSLVDQSTERMGRFSGRGLENPLLRSGLALAGVNTWLQQGTLPTEAEDGILTAEDVSGLDLLATELVVLSACETGLGEVHTGEGVFGLRRAFVLAGARTLVMSLWKVSDLSTAILMERFYHNLLKRRMGRDESLREAQFHTRDLSVGAIRDGWLRAEVIESLAAGDQKAKNYFQRLARKPDEHRPFSGVESWGAFICQGDPAAMV